MNLSRPFILTALLIAFALLGGTHDVALGQDDPQMKPASKCDAALLCDEGKCTDETRTDVFVGIWMFEYSLEPDSGDRYGYSFLSGYDLSPDGQMYYVDSDFRTPKGRWCVDPSGDFALVSQKYDTEKARRVDDNLVVVDAITQKQNFARRHEGAMKQLRLTQPYNDIGAFHEGLARVNIGAMVGGAWGFINENGEEVIPVEYAGVGHFSEGLAWFKRYDETPDGGPSGYLDKSGQVVLPAIYDTAEDFEGGKAKVSKDGRMFFINAKGEQVPAE